MDRLNTSSSSGTGVAAAASSSSSSAPAVNKKKKVKAITTKTTTKKAPKEKRPGRYRSSCPQHLHDRIQRGLSQRLYLVERQEAAPGSISACTSTSCNFVVLGSTGNVYTVTLAGNPSCNCPDFCRRQDLCKHLIFVMIKVIGLSTNDPLSYQKAYTPSEVGRLLEMARARRVGGTCVMANRRVQQQFAKSKSGQDGNDDDDEQEGDYDDHGQVQRRSLEEDSDCPICFDSMDRLSETTFCRAQCGANFHTKCIRLWCQRSSSSSSSSSATGSAANRQAATCPACRQPWQSETASTTPLKRGDSGNGGVNEEGYVNLGRLQGQSPDRDTSTYYSSPYRGKRSRRWY